MTFLVEDFPTELGLPDGRLDVLEEADPYISKVGGKPTLLFRSALLDHHAKCSRCQASMYLALQLDAPADKGYDRVIYVFACNSRECTESGLEGVATALIQCRKVDAHPKDRWAGVPTSKPSASAWDSFVSGSSLSDELSALKITNNTKVEDAGDSCYLASYPVAYPATRLHIVEEFISATKQHSAAKASTLPAADSTDAAGESWAGEVYEKMSVAGYDKVFKAFHSRVSHYPRQLVRYSPEGQELFFSADPLPAVAPCAHCNGSRHFELQLMPAILSHLPINDGKHLKHISPAHRGKHPLFSDGMEWGTILVYSCGVCKAKEATQDQAEFLGQVVIQIERE